MTPNPRAPIPPSIPPSIPQAIERAISVEQAKPVPMIPGALVISGAVIFDRLQEIDPALCRRYGPGTIKRLITIAVHQAGGSVWASSRSTGYNSYEFPVGAA